MLLPQSDENNLKVLLMAILLWWTKNNKVSAKYFCLIAQKGHDWKKTTLRQNGKTIEAKVDFFLRRGKLFETDTDKGN